MDKRFIACLAVGLCMACHNQQAPITNSIQPQDTTTNNNADCYQAFFDGQHNQAWQKIMLLPGNGKPINVQDFMLQRYDTAVQALAVLKDVDKDGVQECWVRGYTGGVHCCDEWTVFTKKNGEYVQTAQLQSGDVCVSQEIFMFSFSQLMGYFNACYACGVETDSSKNYVQIREISLKYTRGRFEALPLTATQTVQLEKNLLALGKAISTYQPANEEDETLGNYAKEFAINLAIFYFTNHKDWGKVQQLYQTYYPQQNKILQLTALKDVISIIEQENTL